MTLGMEWSREFTVNHSLTINTLNIPIQYFSSLSTFACEDVVCIVNICLFMYVGKHMYACEHVEA